VGSVLIIFGSLVVGSENRMKDWRILSCSSVSSLNFTHGRSLVIPDLDFNNILHASTMVSVAIILATLTFLAH
jgi:hypothetical protein